MNFSQIEGPELLKEAAVARISLEDLDYTTARIYASLKRVPGHLRGGQSGSLTIPISSGGNGKAICGKAEGATIELVGLVSCSPLEPAKDRHVQMLRNRTAHRPWGAIELEETLHV